MDSVMVKTWRHQTMKRMYICFLGGVAGGLLFCTATLWLLGVHTPLKFKVVVAAFTFACLVTEMILLWPDRPKYEIKGTVTGRMSSTADTFGGEDEEA